MFGEVQGHIVGGTLHDFPKGVTVNTDRIKLGLKLRQDVATFTDAYKPEDTPTIISGITGGVTNGAPITIQFENKQMLDRHFSSYFSPRFTLPMVFFGMLAMDYLSQKGIHIVSHVKAIGETADDVLPPVYDKVLFDRLNSSPFAVINSETKKRMVSLLTSLKATGDSTTCKIQTVAVGLPKDLKSPLFDNLDARIARLVFPIPSVNGVCFDKVIDDTLVMTTSCRRTPTVAEQEARQYQVLDLDIKRNHVPCAVPRATIVVTSAVALSILDAMLEKNL